MDSFFPNTKSKMESKLFSGPAVHWVARTTSVKNNELDHNANVINHKDKTQFSQNCPLSNSKP